MASTDHSREYVPVLLYSRVLTAGDLGTREGFFHIGATLADIFGIDKFDRGESLISS